MHSCIQNLSNSASKARKAMLTLLVANNNLFYNVVDTYPTVKELKKKNESCKKSGHRIMPPHCYNDISCNKSNG